MPLQRRRGSLLFFQSVALFDLANTNSNLSGLFQGTPNRTENHRLLMIIFQMATLIAVDVEDLTHGDYLDFLGFVRQPV